MRFFKVAALMFASVLGLNMVKATNVKNTSIDANTIPRVPATSFARSVPYGDAKSYGQAIGNGGSKKSNRNRYSHNAKVKRRNSAS